MTVTKETVPLKGMLKGEGLERLCRVRAIRREIFEDEGTRPLCVSYSRCDIEDTDNFPEGEYELSFDDHSIRLVKQAGRYILQ